MKLHHVINEFPTFFTTEKLPIKVPSLQRACVDIQSWALEETERDSWDEIQKLQLRRIRRLVNFAYRHTDFWKNILDTAGINPTAITSLKDFQNIPITPKKLIKTTPLEKRIAIPSDSPRLFHITTSGSTGTPTPLVHDVYITERFTAVRDRAIRWTLGERRKKDDIYIRVFPRYQPQTDPIVMGVPDFKDIEILKEKLKKLSKEKKCVITSHTAIMLRLAELVEKEKISLPIKCISVSGEEVQLPTLRYLEKVFQCPVTIRYTSTESGSGQIAQLCAHEKLHINPDQHYLELVHDEEVGKEFSGEKRQLSGKLIITELNNLIMPLIRYEIGDLATLFPAESCSCGSVFPVIEFVGRDTSKITLPNGETHFIWKILSPLAQVKKRPWVLQFQMIRRSYSHFEIYVVTTKKENVEDLAILKKELEKNLGEGTYLTITVVSEIKKDAGEKLRSYISTVKT